MKKLITILFFLIGLITFSFAQIPNENLELWLKAENVEIINGKVHKWFDSSDNSYELIQNTENSRPLFIDSVLSDKAALEFDGVNDFFSFLFNEQLSGPISIYTIWKTSAGGARVFLDNPSTGIIIDINTGNHIRIGSGTTSFSYAKSSPFEFILTSAIYNNINSQIYENGLIKGEGSLNNLILTGLNIGKWSVSNARWFSGSVAEIIVYNSVLNNDEKKIVEDYLMDKYSEEIDLGENIEITYGFCDVLLEIPSSFTDVLWSTGEITSSIRVDKSGEYFVEAKDIFGRTKYDTISVNFEDQVILENETLCLNDSILISPGLTGIYNYLWSTGSIDPQIWIKQDGNYWVEISDTLGCSNRISFNIEIDRFSEQISLGDDLSLCSGNSISLIEGSELVTNYYWENGGETGPSKIVNHTGWEKLRVENENGCTAVDSIYITIIGNAPGLYYEVNNICYGDITKFIGSSDQDSEIVDWTWVLNNEDTLKTQIAEWQFQSYGFQNVKFVVEAENGCKRDSLFIIEIYENPQVIFNNNRACSNVEINFISEVVIPENSNITSYNWTINGNIAGNSQDLFYTFDEDGQYEISLEVILDNGCSGLYIKQVMVYNEYPDPEVTRLINPFEGYFLESETEVINFEWNRSDNAIFYDLLIASDEDFNNIVYEERGIYSTNHEVLLEDVQNMLYWKVISYNACHIQSESEIRELLFFDISSIQGLKLWVDGDSTEIINNKVRRWYDLSPESNELIQESENNRPSKIFTKLNNHSALRFIANNLNFFSFYFDQEIYQPYTFFIVWKTNSAGQRVLLDNQSNLIMDIYGGSSVRMTAASSILYSKQSPFDYIITSAEYNGADSRLYENFILKESGNIGINEIPGLNIGRWSASGGSRYFDGDIASIILTDRILNYNEKIMVEEYLHNKYAPPVNLGHDIYVTEGFCDTVINNSYKPWFQEYLWSTGETDSVIHVNRPGIYSLTVTDIFGIESIDEIRVFYPQVEQLRDTIVCYGSEIVWNTKLDEINYDFEWIGNPETGSSLIISEDGDYAAIITDRNGCKFYTDTITMNFDNYEFEANIGPEDTTLCSGNRLMLISNSIETVSYNWSDGSTNPEIQVTQSGEYSVTVTNWRGCTALDTINVNISGVVPYPAFDNFGHCEKNSVNFIDESMSASSEIVEWIWEINNVVVSQSTEFDYVFEESGIYEISLTVRAEDNCSDFIKKDFTVYSLPEVNFIPEYICQNTQILYISDSKVDNGSIVYNLWQFGNETKTGNNVYHTFNDYGFKEIKLISSTNMSCTDSIIRNVYVRNAELPSYETKNSCTGDITFFINNTIQNPINPVIDWIWDFGDGNVSFYSNPQHVYSEAGIFSTELKIKYANGCELQTEKLVDIYHNAQIIIQNLNACELTLYMPVVNELSEDGEIISYHWLIGDEYESYVREPEFLIEQEGKYEISLQVETDLGCTSIFKDSINVHKSPVSLFKTSRDQGAIPLYVQFYNESNGGINYEWDFDDNNYSNESDPGHIFYNEGEYNVKLEVTSENGCSAISTQSINAVSPVLDLILYNLRTVDQNGFMKISVYVINRSNISIENLELLLNVGNGKIYREIIGYISAGGTIDYTFNAEIYGNSDIEFICIEVDAPILDIYSDNNINDNSLCNTYSDSFKVYKPYPNPSYETLNFEIISSHRTNVLISLVNLAGKEVYKTVYNNFDGYRQFNIDVSKFSEGMYFLNIVSNKKVESFKIEIIKQ